MIEITIPKLGLTMEEATLLEWQCLSGDHVKKDDILLVIETDKITYEVASPADGIIHPVVAEGTVCNVNKVVAFLAQSQDEYEQIIKRYPVSPTQGKKPAHTEPGLTPPHPAKRSPAHRIKASPLARSIATQHNIALEQIKGSGPGGRIVKADVLAAIEQQRSGPGVSADQAREDKAEIIPIRGARKAIFDNMWQSITQSAQLTLHCDASAVALVSLKNRLTRLGKNISYNAFFIKLAAASLTIHRNINASVNDGHIYLWRRINIGLAMEKDDVLIVPVVKDADKKSIAEIEQDISGLISRLRDNSLSPDDLAGGTFTISNLGFAGIDYFTPIIRPPESAILGIGRIMERPSVNNGQVIAEPKIGLSLTFDHRIIDGTPAARFLNTIREFIEDPSLLLVYGN